MESADMNWRKTTYSNGGENCVEVADHAGRVLIRDTKDQGSGPVVAVSPTVWRTFIGSV